MHILGARIKSSGMLLRIFRFKPSYYLGNQVVYVIYRLNMQTPSHKSSREKSLNQQTMKMEGIMHMIAGINMLRPARIQFIGNLMLSENDINSGTLQVLNLPQFLCNVDINFASNQAIPLWFLSPRHPNTFLTLVRYQNLMYGLTSGWSRMVQVENFQVGDMVQLWCFTEVNNNLHLAMYHPEGSSNNNTNQSKYQLHALESVKIIMAGLIFQLQGIMLVQCQKVIIFLQLGFVYFVVLLILFCC